MQQPCPRFAGLPCDMRRYNAVGAAEQRMICRRRFGTQYIGCIPADGAIFRRCGNRLIIDKLPPSGIDNKHTRFTFESAAASIIFSLVLFSGAFKLITSDLASKVSMSTCFAARSNLYSVFLKHIVNY